MCRQIKLLTRLQLLGLFNLNEALHSRDSRRWDIRQVHSWDSRRWDIRQAHSRDSHRWDISSVLYNSAIPVKCKTILIAN